MKKKDNINIENAMIKDNKIMSNTKEKTFTFDELNQLLNSHKEVLTNTILVSLVSNTSVNKLTAEEKNKIKYAVESTVSEQFVSILTHFRSKKN